jgi:hypothetical protein
MPIHLSETAQRGKPSPEWIRGAGVSPVRLSSGSDQQTHPDDTTPVLRIGIKSSTRTMTSGIN